ncbi:hypothetical protein BGZ83_000021 [Gryganskiella cystojenkinii]|nr:hypothetical protein BGZ83_000021 [Gryganskiella cystojenkinii]
MSTRADLAPFSQLSIQDESRLTNATDTCDSTTLVRNSRDQQQQQQQRQQRLPNECLLLVVDWLHDDLKALTALLTVSKFMFKAALPLILRDPLDSWEMNYCSSPHIDKRERMMAVLLSSLLRYQVKNRQSTGQLVDDPVTEILAEFGLRLVRPIRHKELEWTTLPTVDYSTFFTVMVPYDWRYLALKELIQLVKLPAVMRGRVYPTESIEAETASSQVEQPIEQGQQENAPDPVDSRRVVEREDINNAVEEQEVHSEDQQTDDDYKWELQEALARLFLCYNHEFITYMSIHISQSHVLLPLASKMPRLCRLYLSRDEAMPDGHLRDLIAFIEQRQLAFPRKPRLILNFDHSWYIHYPGESGPRSKAEREEWSRKQRPKIDLYKALRQPRDMNVDQIPDFYSQCEGIELDCLQEFSDEFITRYDDGENPARAEFLKRCHALLSLNLAVGNPYILSWAARHALTSAAMQSLNEKCSSVGQVASAVLPKLKDLQLVSYRPVRFLIHALNDAATAFSQSLQSLEGDGYIYDDEDVANPEFIPYFKAQHALSALLRSVPEACTIGNWPFQLPYLRTIHLRVHGSASIAIGSLDQCPNLEELEITFGYIGAFTQEEYEGDSNNDDGSGDDQVSTLQAVAAENVTPWHHHTIQPQSQTQEQTPQQQQQQRQPSSRYIREATALFPKWTLPRLRTIRLRDSAALRFNYESLESMQSLERLDFFVAKKAHLLNYLHFIPRLAAHCTYHHQVSSPAKESESGQDQDQDYGPKVEKEMDMRTWTCTWHLPKLTTLRMEGPLANVFNLDWLQACPRLSELFLVTRGSPQRVPLFSQSAALYSTPTVPTTGQDHQAHQSVLSGTVPERPFLDSKLRLIDLKGPWVMTSGDMIRLLTIYAPHLHVLMVGHLSDQEAAKGSGFRLLKTLREADSINRAYIKEHVPAYLELMEDEQNSEDEEEEHEKDEEEETVLQHDQENPEAADCKRQEITIEKEKDIERRQIRSQKLQELARRVPGQGLTAFVSNYSVGQHDLRGIGLFSRGHHNQGSSYDESNAATIEYRAGLGLTGKRQGHRVYIMAGQTLSHTHDRRNWV